MEDNAGETSRFVLAEDFTHLIGTFFDKVIFLGSGSAYACANDSEIAYKTAIDIGGPLPDEIVLTLPRSDFAGAIALELLKYGKKLWEPRWFFAEKRIYPNWMLTSTGEKDPKKDALASEHATTMAEVGTQLCKLIGRMVTWPEPRLRQIQARAEAIFCELINPPDALPQPLPFSSGHAGTTTPKQLTPKAEKFLKIAEALELEVRINGYRRELEAMPYQEAGDLCSRVTYEVNIPQSLLPDVCQWPEFVNASEESLRRFGRPLDSISARMLSAEAQRTEFASAPGGTSSKRQKARPGKRPLIETNPQLVNLYDLVLMEWREGRPSSDIIEALQAKKDFLELANGQNKVIDAKLIGKAKKYRKENPK